MPFFLQEAIIAQNILISNTANPIEPSIIMDPKKGYGKYVEQVDLNNLGLKSGVYLFKLEINHQVKTIRQVVIP